MSWKCVQEGVINFINIIFCKNWIPSFIAEFKLQFHYGRLIYIAVTVYMLLLLCFWEICIVSTASWSERPFINGTISYLFKHELSIKTLSIVDKEDGPILVGKLTVLQRLKEYKMLSSCFFLYLSTRQFILISPQIIKVNFKRKSFCKTNSKLV